MSVADFKIPSVQRSSISPAEVLLASRSINSQKSCPPNWNFRRVKNPFSNFVSEPIVRCLSSPMVHWFPKLIFHSFRLLRLRSQWLLQRDSSLLPKRTSKYVLRWIEIFRKHSSPSKCPFCERSKPRKKEKPAGLARIQQENVEERSACSFGLLVFRLDASSFGTARVDVTAHICKKKKAELHLEISQKGDGDDDDRLVWETGSSSKQQQRGSPTGK